MMLPRRPRVKLTVSYSKTMVQSKTIWQSRDGWHSGESSRLPPMQPRFNATLVPYVGLVCCWFLPYFNGVLPGSPVFLPLQIPTSLNSKSNRIEDLHEN